MDVAIFSSRPKSITNEDRCCVKNYDSNAKVNSNLIFHNFPKPNERFVEVENTFGNLEKLYKLRAWKIALKINQVFPKIKVCSLHFKKSDYILPGMSNIIYHKF